MLEGPRGTANWLRRQALSATAATVVAVAVLAPPSQAVPGPGPRTPAIPHNEVIVVGVSGAQQLGEHYSYQSVSHGSCSTSESAEGTETLRFRTPEPVDFTLLALGRFVSILPDLISPLGGKASDVATTQVREASARFSVTPSSCKHWYPSPPFPPFPTSDCGKDIAGTADTLELTWTPEYGQGIQLNFSDIKSPYAGAVFHCPWLTEADETPPFDLEPGAVSGEPYGEGLLTHVSAAQLSSLPRGGTLRLSNAVRLKAEAACLSMSTPPCEGSGKVNWEINITRVR